MVEPDLLAEASAVERRVRVALGQVQHEVDVGRLVGGAVLRLGDGPQRAHQRQEQRGQPHRRSGGGPRRVVPRARRRRRWRRSRRPRRPARRRGRGTGRSSSPRHDRTDVLGTGRAAATIEAEMSPGGNPPVTSGAGAGQTGASERSNVSTLRAASGMLVPGPNTAATPAAVQRVVVLRRDDAAAHDHHVPGARGLELLDELGHQRLVARGLARHADDVHVVVDRVAGGLGRRLEQRADVDVEAEVGEGGGDDLGPAVVAVLAHLHDQHAGPAALGLGERLDVGLHRLERHRRPRRPRRTRPWIERISALWRSNTCSMASLISPTVARARAASMHRASRLPSPAAPSVRRRERVLAGLPRRGSARTRSSRAICWRAHVGVVDVEHVDVLGVRRLVLVDADDRPPRRGRRGPGGGRPTPRCAAWACPTRPPWSCRPAPRPPRSGPRPRRPARSVSAST